MKIAAPLARHRRLAGLVVLSLLLHLLALAWVDGRPVAPPLPAPGTNLAVRLAPPALPQPAAAPAAAPASVAGPAIEAPPLGLSRAGASPAPARLSTAEARSGATPSLEAGPAAPGAADPVQMPGRYQVHPPPPARLSYAVTRARPGEPAGEPGAAYLLWQLANGSYRLRVDGVLGEIESEGGEDDAGIAPSRAREHGAAGRVLSVEFDRMAQRIDAGPGAYRAPLHIGSQDRASVLIQLAGIGRAEPDQMQEVIEIVVGSAHGVGIERFQLLGHEELVTGAGRLGTVHLVRLSRAGEAVVELWFAPDRHWLPVQLRVTEPDGTVANQLLTAIETDAATPAM